MKNTLKIFRFSLALAGAAILAIGSAAYADRFTGDGDGTTWEDPTNWLAAVVPVNNGSNILIGADHQVVFDADTFAALLAAGNTQSGTEHRIARLLMGDNTSGAFNGSHSLTFDQGAGITVRATNSNSAVIGGRPGKFTTLNIVSGITNLEANRVRVGQALDGSGTINLSGGEFICGRGGLELSNINGTGGDGTLNITGGSFTTRNDVEIFAGGVFNVVGSSATLIGIGSHTNIDGAWSQQVGGVLRLGMDAGGVTPILIDEVDGDPAASSNGVATFAAGSILEVSDLGGFPTGTWVTVLSAEGGITGAPTLSAASVAAGFESRITGNNLEVRLTGGGTPLKGDVDLSGVIDFADIPAFIAVLQAGAFQAEADCDCSGNVDFADIPAFIAILQQGG